MPRPASARAARSQPKPGAKAQAALPSEKAAIESAIEARRPSRSLIQPKRSPPTPVIPTPTAVRVARSPSDRPNALLDLRQQEGEERQGVESRAPDPPRGGEDPPVRRDRAVVVAEARRSGLRYREQSPDILTEIDDNDPHFCLLVLLLLSPAAPRSGRRGAMRAASSCGCINAERQRAGSPPLRLSPELTRAAQAARGRGRRARLPEAAGGLHRGDARAAEARRL